MPEYGNSHHANSLSPETTYTAYNPDNQRFVSVKAVVDTGAVMTIIPQNKLYDLGGVRIYSRRRFQFADGRVYEKRTYIMNITVEGKDENDLEVLALDRKQGLIGRDILNKHKVVLNAPRGQWSLGVCDSPCLFSNENEI